MIDIHTHILPAVDDGATSVTESLEMARIAVNDGITHLFATPHHRDYTRLSRQEVADRVARLQAELDAADIPLTLLPGYEVRLYDNVLEDWNNHIAGPLADSRYILAEPLFHRFDSRTDKILFELFDRGYIPVMAHPERIRPIQDDLSLIEPFLARGGLTQITADSLVPGKDWRANTIAETMLRQGMVHIIASDAHKPYRRQPILSQARDAAALIVGDIQAKAMVTATPQAIVNNEPVATIATTA